MSEVEREKKTLPPLSQSRYSDMACETLYVHKRVHCAKLEESEPCSTRDGNRRELVRGIHVPALG
jgi:hypothetical protein